MTIEQLKAENARLKAEVERLTVAADWKTPARKIQALEAEVERLRASSFVTAVPVEQYEKLQAEVERLRKATEWQPIETAPAFPTKILFGGFFKPGWGEGFWWQHGYKAGALDIEATHWMPEPQPPAAKEGKQP